MWPKHEALSRIIKLVQFLSLKKILFTNLRKVKRQFGVMKDFCKLFPHMSI